MVKSFKRWWIKFTQPALIEQVIKVKTKLDIIIKHQLPNDITKGICSNTGLRPNLIKQFGTDWKYYSGSSVYPISGEEKYFTCLWNESLWKDGQLELRLSFCSHMLNKMQNLLKDIGVE